MAKDGECNPTKKNMDTAEPAEVVQPPLSSKNIAEFVERGFTTLRGAFSPEAATRARSFLWEKRLEPAGLFRDDPSSWVVRHGVPEVFQIDATTPWVTNVLTPRLRAAYDQLLGPGRYVDQDMGLGWWVISFPGQEDPPWGASGHFHVDGADFRHYPWSRGHGLRPIFIFSDLKPGDGGTALAVGSHIRVAQLLEEHASTGLEGGALSSAALALPGILDEIVEVNGRPGDVVLAHPLLVHARSKNLGTYGVNSVRFGCFPSIQMREELVISGRADEAEYNAVELVFVRARERGVCPMAFGGGRRKASGAPPRGRRRKRRRERKPKGA